MFPHRVAPRVAKLFCALLLSFVFGACPQPTMQATRKKPAEVTLPPKGSLNAVQEVDKLLAKFEWGEAHDAPCQGCQTPSDVSIRSIGLTKDIKESNGPAKRRIVALIQNYSDQDVKHTPSNWTFKANTRYLMFVEGRKSDNKAQWGFIDLGPGYNPDTAAIGLLKSCGHKPPSTKDDANFQGCSDPYPPSASSGWIKTAYAASRAGGSISKPGWITCDPDCCTGTTEQQ